MTDFAQQLAVWPLVPPTEVAPVPHSENRVLRLVDGAGRRFILRLHRPGYHDSAEITSELDWIAALARDTGLLVPEVIATRSGDTIAPVTAPGESRERLAVLFAENHGEQPDERDPRLPDIFEALGAAAAQCHSHVEAWAPPQGFRRPDWTIRTTLLPNGIWGDWRAAPGLSVADRALLETATERLDAAFTAYGQAPDRFGLIHNDMRPSNFLWHAGALRLIDFDDCGHSWFIADFAASVSWFETDPRLPELFARWQVGYRRHRALGDADLAMAGPAIMARRLLLLAWSASRADTDLAAAHAKGFVEGTIALTRRFLDGDGLV